MVRTLEMANENEERPPSRHTSSAVPRCLTTIAPPPVAMNFVVSFDFQ